MNLMLYSNECPINNHITIRIPTLGEICGYGELKYFQLITMLIATSKDYMVQLNDMGVDYEKITDFELFSQLLFKTIQTMDTEILFGNLKLSDFELAMNEANHELILYNKYEDITIDRYSYHQLCAALRDIHSFEKDNTKAGNTEAKAFMIDCARRKQKHAANKPQKLILQPLIISLVNCPEFKYNYEQTYDMNIYKFYTSVHAIQKRINYDQIMSGIYAGTLSSKDINMQEISWLR